MYQIPTWLIYMRDVCTVNNNIPRTRLTETVWKFYNYDNEIGMKYKYCN